MHLCEAPRHGPQQVPLVGPSAQWAPRAERGLTLPCEPKAGRARPEWPGHVVEELELSTDQDGQLPLCLVEDLKLLKSKATV